MQYGNHSNKKAEEARLAAEVEAARIVAEEEAARIAAEVDKMVKNTTSVVKGAVNIILVLMSVGVINTILQGEFLLALMGAAILVWVKYCIEK